MAVDTTLVVSAANSAYVPYHIGQRGGDEGNTPVGTLDVDAEATGAAGGGAVTLRIFLARQVFGFPMMWVPTIVSLLDNLSSAEVAVVRYGVTGNVRMTAGLEQAVTLVANSGTGNAGQTENVTIPIEPSTDSAQEVLQAIWDTNTDTKVYHMHVFGPVYDLQVLAENGARVPNLMAGIR